MIHFSLSKSRGRAEHLIRRGVPRAAEPRNVTMFAKWVLNLNLRVPYWKSLLGVSDWTKGYLRKDGIALQSACFLGNLFVNEASEIKIIR